MANKSIESAIHWYRANLATIQALLPLEVPKEPYGISLYPANWDITYWIAKWENNLLSEAEAEQYICAQLRPLFAVVRDRLVNG